MCELYGPEGPQLPGRDKTSEQDLKREEAVELSSAGYEDESQGEGRRPWMGWSQRTEEGPAVKEEEAAVGSVGTGSVPVTVRKSQGEGLGAPEQGVAWRRDSWVNIRRTSPVVQG